MPNARCPRAMCTSRPRCALAGLCLLVCAKSAADAQARPPADTGARRDSVRSLPGVAILGRPDALNALPGSAARLEHSALLRTRVLTTAEALRKVAGVNVRDEEGLGLRPNIGLRGLNPTRSTKVLLLEDGIPLSIAPYGDNASYYHPPIERFDRIEVVKGAGQILYGPNTVGGVINYITPGLPVRPEVTAAVDAGSQGYGRLHVIGRGLFQENGVFAELLRKRAESPARENTESDVTDGQLKLMMSLGRGQTLVARANAYEERSRVTYSGLTEEEWAADPRQNPFTNDRFSITRIAGAVTHNGAWSDKASATTTLYAYAIDRDWWRQSSNSSQRPNDASDASCGGMASLHTTCGNEGRLREYRVFGVEPRVSLGTALAGRPFHLDAGARLHAEWQDRQQVNGQFPRARTAGPSADRNSGIVEDNARAVRAAAAFAQGRLALGPWTLSSGLRVEHMRLTRTNRRPTATNPEGVHGEQQLTELIPGFGATFNTGTTTLYWGLHRGFSPPRPEDVIDNSTGGVIDLPSERSWNYEMGTRARLSNIFVDATLFALEFTSQIIPASVAGGSGAALTSAGATQHRGLEVSLRADTLSTLSRAVLFSSASVTWVPVARFADERYAFLGTGTGDVAGKVYSAQNAAGARQQVLVKGNRLPYAPKLLATGELGIRLGGGSLASIEVVHIGRQFGDAVNTRVPVPDGQQGVISSGTIWNLSLGTTLRRLETDTYVTVKNVFDKLYVVDRTRGLLPGGARMVTLGLRRTL